MKNLKFTVNLTGESSTINFGKTLAKHLSCGQIIYLLGNLGAGKTTLVRGVLRGLGFEGKVKSPTYAIVEPYENINKLNAAYHFDLYRLADPEELEFLGIRDYIEDKKSLCLIEWPEKGKGFLPDADVILNFIIGDNQRTIEAFGISDSGEKYLDEINKDINNFNNL